MLNNGLCSELAAILFLLFLFFILVHRCMLLYNFLQLQIHIQFLLFIPFFEVHYQTDYHQTKHAYSNRTTDYYCVSPPCNLFLLCDRVKLLLSWLRNVQSYFVSFSELLQHEFRVGTIDVLKHTHYILFWQLPHLIIV